jgi:hypothetical protein
MNIHDLYKKEYERRNNLPVEEKLDYEQRKGFLSRLGVFR